MGMSFLRVFVQSMDDKHLGIVNTSFDLVSKLQWVKTFVS